MHEHPIFEQFLTNLFTQMCTFLILEQHYLRCKYELTKSEIGDRYRQCVTQSAQIDFNNGVK